MFKSIRLQAQCYYGGLILLLVTVGLISLFQYERETRLKLLDRELAEEVITLMPLIFRPEQNGPRDLRNEERPRERPIGPHERENEEAYLQSLMDKGYYFIAYNALGIEIRRTENAPLVDSKAGDKWWVIEGARRWNGSGREMAHQLPRGNTLVLGFWAEGWEASLNDFFRRVILLSLGSVVLVLVLGWMLMGRALKPITQITETARAISEGNQGERIDVGTMKNELGDLAKILNQTYDRLTESVQRQVQVTADASHELRTPVAVILAECDLALRPDCRVERRLETIELCRETALHMRQLIESLTQMSRWDGEQIMIKKTACDVGELGRQVVGMLQPLAEEHQITLAIDAETAMAEIDPLAIKQAITNIVSNGIYYNEPNGRVDLWIYTRDGFHWIEISDTGVGIAEGDLRFIFDRFYRVNQARDMMEGRSGLGLAITQAIIKAHGGSIEVESVVGEGSVFRIKLKDLWWTG